MIAEDGFDFSKPYEPANDRAPARKQAAAEQPSRKRRPARETAVLLGGSHRE